MKTTTRVDRTFLNQNNCGTSMLQDIIITQPHQYGPSARFMKWNCSAGLPEYHAMKNSMM